MQQNGAACSCVPKHRAGWRLDEECQPMLAPQGATQPYTVVYQADQFYLTLLLIHAGKRRHRNTAVQRISPRGRSRCVRPGARKNP
jgi:hypothetical protein